MQNRQFVRHPSDVPIVVDYDLSGVVAHKTDYLKDISFGGLSLESNKALHKNAVVHIAIPIVKPVFEILGRVAWSHKAEDHYDIGVEFIEPEKIFKARLVEQVCQIEHYKKEILEKEGRRLTSEEVAVEWIRKYAADFPPLRRSENDS